MYRASGPGLFPSHESWIFPASTEPGGWWWLESRIASLQAGQESPFPQNVRLCCGDLSVQLAESRPFSPFCHPHGGSFWPPYHKQLGNLRGEAHECGSPPETAAQGFSFTTVHTPLLQSPSSKLPLRHSHQPVVHVSVGLGALAPSDFGGIEGFPVTSVLQWI